MEKACVLWFVVFTVFALEKKKSEVKGQVMSLLATLKSEKVV